MATSDLSARDERTKVGRRPARLQPLTPVEAGVPQVPLVRGGLRPCRGPVRVPAARGRGRREPDPGGHGAPRLAQQRGVPVRLVEVPGGADHDVTPSGRAVERAEAAVEALGGRARRDVGDAPVGALVERHVAQPLAGEGEHVVQVRRGRREDLPVAGPARALALRAVGRDVAHVRPQGPHHRLVEPADAVVAAGEPAEPAQVGVHDHAGDVIGAERAGLTLDPDVPEAMRGEARLEHVAVTRRDDLVDLAERQPLGEDRQVDVQVRGGQIPVGVEPLAVRQRHRAARGPQLSQPHPAAEVLPEVDHEGVPAAHRPHGGRPDLLHPAHRGSDRPDDGDVDVAGNSLAPRSVVKGHVVHARLQPSAVLSLAADQVGRGDVRTRGSPARLAGRRDLPARPGPHLELGAQRHVAAVLVGRPEQPDLAAVPPVGQQDGEHVPARPRQRRDVVGLILHPRAVLGVTRREFGVADTRAVQERLVQAERGEVQPGPGRPGERRRAS